MSARERVIDAERQVRAIAAGQLQEIHCPFCGLTTPGGMEMLCCENLADIVNAVLDHLEVKQSFEIIDRVLERVQKAGLN